MRMEDVVGEIVRLLEEFFMGIIDSLMKVWNMLFEYYFCRVLICILFYFLLFGSVIWFVE